MPNFKIPQVFTLILYFAPVGKMWGKTEQIKKLSIYLSNT